MKSIGKSDEALPLSLARRESKVLSAGGSCVIERSYLASPCGSARYAQRKSESSPLSRQSSVFGNDNSIRPRVNTGNLSLDSPAGR